MGVVFQQRTFCLWFLLKVRLLYATSASLLYLLGSSTAASPSKLTSYPEINLEAEMGGPEFSAFVNDCAQTDKTDNQK